MKPRFEPDVPSEANPGLSASLIDPEAYDASEQHFAASLEQSPFSAQPRFVVEDNALESAKETEPEGSWLPSEVRSAENQEAAMWAPVTAEPPPDPDSWRREVAARLSHYR